MAEDGEEVESTLMYDNTFDYNPEWMSNLQDVEESRKFTMKCLEKMGLHGSQGKIILMASSPTKTLLTIPQVQHHPSAHKAKENFKKSSLSFSSLRS